MNPNVTVLPKLLLVFFFLLLVFPASKGQKFTAQKVTIEGQLVCSQCWFEADRKTTAYGTTADIECAKDCAVKGVPPAVAVKQGDEFKLYLIKAGQFKRNSKEWLDFIGKWVQVSGRLGAEKDRKYAAVDELKVLKAANEAVETQNAVGSEPELALRDLFGIEQKLTAYRGKIVVLNFWATWCIPAAKRCRIWPRFKTITRPWVYKSLALLRTR